MTVHIPQFDILSVGDIVTDAYIHLNKVQAITFEDKGSKWLAMPFGAKLPFDGSHIVKAAGNASNAAISFARLGLRTALVTNVGGDQEGLEMINIVGHESVDTRFMRINPKTKSNYHYVLWYGNERTILVKHEDYEYHWPHVREIEKPRWLYLTSVGQGTLEYHEHILEWLNANPNVLVAFQPGTFQIKTGVKRLAHIYKRSAILVVNREEAVTIVGKEQDVPALLDSLHALGPMVVVITDGNEGAWGSDGRHKYFMPVYRNGFEPIERLGAGDAFASTFVAAAVKGMGMEDALCWAPINAASVISKIGPHAGLLTERDILTYLHDASKTYKPRKVQ
jgi:sugar/nucleoside kinase (ribokinase family)